MSPEDNEKDKYRGLTKTKLYLSKKVKSHPQI